jgi:hypothetical protein
MLARNRVAASLVIILMTADARCFAASATSAVPSAAGCLPAGNGYLRARIRGALNLDVDWRNAELECQGEARPDGSGIRMSFAGPRRADGHRLRLVFGVRAHEGGEGRALPTNLTVILEGERRLFATRGDDKCTVDRLRQEPFGEHAARDYRVIARGFCTAPATALSGTERIVVSSFDFAGRISYSTPAAAHPGAQR